MFTLYLACLIFGGILLGASLISFGDTHSDVSDSGDGFDASHDTDLDHGTDLHHDTEITGTNHHHDIEVTKSGLMKEAAQFFSFRNIVFFTAFFGLTGTVFTVLDINSIITFISSMALGAFSFVFGFGLMKYLRNSESGEEIRLSELIGKTGVVEIGISKSRKGKVIVSSGSYSREFIAMLSEASKCDVIHRNNKIIVIDISDNILVVDILED